jgi:hypothetical protein
MTRSNFDRRATIIERLKRRAAPSGRTIEEMLFTERRIGFYASGVAIGCGVALAWSLVRHTWAADPVGNPCRDLIWIWLSSKLAFTGSLLQACDFSAFSAARDAVVGPSSCLLEHFDYPPTLLLLGLNVHVLWAVQLVVTIITATVVCALWARPISYALKAAAVAIGAVLANPHLHGYDVCVLCVPVHFSSRTDCRAAFWRASERSCWRAGHPDASDRTDPGHRLCGSAGACNSTRRTAQRERLGRGVPLPSCRDRRCERSRCRHGSCHSCVGRPPFPWNHHHDGAGVRHLAPVLHTQLAWLGC